MGGIRQLPCSLPPLVQADRSAGEVEGGGLSVRKLTGKLIEEHSLAFGKTTVQRWSDALGMKRFRRYLKPKNHAAPPHRVVESLYG